VKAEFLKSTHGQQPCAACHGGEATATTMEQAHTKRTRTPSDKLEQQCGTCHEDIVKVYKTSLHFTTKGDETLLRLRSGGKWPQVEPVYQQACHSCHASCGDCHVRWPQPAGGGLLNGHLFVKKPPTESTCNGCHSGRVSADYFGWNAGQPADVHSTKAKLDCTGCHAVQDLHGDGNPYQHRLERGSQPSCLTCHPQAAPGKSSLEAHNVHGDKLECHVCHSVKYTNCFGCHVGKGSRSELDFKIGRSLRGDKPYSTVLLRHAPTTREMMQAQVPDAMPNYDAIPTWKPTYPHNIQRVTPQNKTCNNCHGNSDLFLLRDKLDPRYPKANENVAFPAPPAKR
jgi:thiosulfate/3-mercaptopyruvate sulfurtransferase